MERKELEKEINDIGEWMKDTTPRLKRLSGNREENIKTIHNQLSEMMESCETYETIVVFHMVNGDSIKVRNHCVSAYCNKYIQW